MYTENLVGMYLYVNVPMKGATLVPAAVHGPS